MIELMPEWDALGETEHGPQRCTTPLVYIVVLTHNGRDDTLECLSSMEKLEYANYRLLLIDNASTDGTVAAVQSRFPGIMVLQNSENLGYAAGNNVGMEVAIRGRAEFVLLANNDITVSPDMLTHLVQACVEDDTIGIAGPTVLYYDEPDRVHHRGCLISRATARGEVARHRDRRRVGDPGGPVMVDYVGGCAILIRSRLAESIGGLDERFFAYYEETDLCFRAQEAGYQVACVPRADCWHKIARHWNRYPLLKMYYEYRNRLLFLWNRASYVRAIRDLALTPAYGAKAAFDAWRRGAGLGLWPASAVAWASVHFVLRRFGKAPNGMDKRWAS
ncbi:MAG: glycosyltransferase family 2 protein [Armatimonadota bacterium]|jgi:GT2 family glycosyltransferase